MCFESSTKQLYGRACEVQRLCGHYFERSINCSIHQRLIWANLGSVVDLQGGWGPRIETQPTWLYLAWKPSRVFTVAPSTLSTFT
jgi:hypothetical protein